MTDYDVKGKASLDTAQFMQSMTRMDKKLDDFYKKMDQVGKKIDQVSKKKIVTSIEIKGREQYQQVNREIDKLNKRRVKIAVDYAGGGSKAPGLDGLKKDFEDIQKTTAQWQKDFENAVSRGANKIKISADTTPARAELDRLKTQMMGLSDKKMNIFIDEKTARGVVAGLQKDLARLANSTPDAKIKMDASGAINELKKFEDALVNVEKAATPSGGGMGLPGGGGMLIGGAIAAGITLVGPATAAATGGVFALAGALGAAYLAYKGLNAERQKGVGAGASIAGSLKGAGNLASQAESAAASAAGPGVAAGIEKLRKFLPELLPYVKEFSASLGKAFNMTSSGLINILQKAEPLLQDGSKYAEEFASKFLSFTESNGFTRFMEYARKETPVVFGMLGDLTTTLVHIGIAAAPLGDALIKDVDALAKFANAIPIKPLTAFVSVLGMAAAPQTIPTMTSNLFKNADQIRINAKDMDEYNTVINSATTRMQAQNDEQIRSITTNIKTDGTISDLSSSYDTAVSKLEDMKKSTSEMDGVGAGHQIIIAGVSYQYDEFQKALALSNGDLANAVGLMNANQTAGSKLSLAIQNIQEKQQNLNTAMAVAEAQTKLSETAVTSYANMLGISAISLANGTISAQTFAGEIAGVSDKMKNGNTDVQEWEKAVDKYSSSAQTAADRSNILKQAIDSLTGGSLDLTTAQANVSAALAAMKDGFDKSQAAAVTATGGLDTMKASSAQLNSAIQAVRDATLNSVQSTYMNEVATKGSAKAAQDSLGVYDAMRGRLYNQFISMGLTAKQAQGLTDKYLGVPKDVNTWIKQFGAGDVNGAIGDVTRNLLGLNGRSAGVSVYAQGVQDVINSLSSTANLISFIQQHGHVDIGVSGRGTAGQADGSILRQYGTSKYANGGIDNHIKSFANGAENHVAQIAKAGEYRLWAENETGGEAYIPMGAAKRPRSTKILRSVADSFGYKLVASHNASSSDVVASGGIGNGGGSDTQGLADALTQALNGMTLQIEGHSTIQGKDIVESYDRAVLVKNRNR